MYHIRRAEILLSSMTMRLMRSILFIVICFVSLGPMKINGENIALGQPTVQSSIGFEGVPSRAVDGNTYSNYNRRSCTHTAKGDKAPYWLVDLGREYTISKVVVYNRKDCCSERLQYSVVYISNSNVTSDRINGFTCGTVSRADASLPKLTMDCQDHVGRYVIIRKFNEYLTLCEVEVFGTRNVALRQPAVQSSTAWGGVPARAVDGNTDTKYDRRSCTHTATDDKAPYWRVDLGMEYNISQVVIYNRQDCCAERLQNSTVYISASAGIDGHNCGTISNADAKQARVVVPCQGVVGRFVTIKKFSQYLTLCEVFVFGTRNNLALGKPAIQSSTISGGLPPRAVDGNTDTNYGRSSCTHTATGDKAPYWRVDLGMEYNISQVVIYNRQDCCAERLQNSTVYVSTSDRLDGHSCGTVSNVDAKLPKLVLSCEGVVGRYVIIKKFTQYLTLCEVKVFGTSGVVRSLC